MTDLSTSSIQTFGTGYVTDLGGVAAVVLTATIGLGIGIFLTFWVVNKIKGGLG